MNLGFLETDDIFISYARGDASTYAPGLADRLIDRGFSCFIDRYGTDPNRDLPDTLRAKIRSCRMFVLIATPRAAASEAIAQEIVEFQKTGRAARIVPIDVAGALRTARWLPLVEGIAPETECNARALVDGNPSDAVVSRIEKSFAYVRGKERLRRATIGAGVLLAALLAAGVGAAGYALQQVAEANRARTSAAVARGEATALAREARDMREARNAAMLARDDAARQQAAAEALRDRARAEAERQSTIADAGRDTNAARQMLVQRPIRLLQGVALGAQALKKAASVNAEGLGADRVLRDGLALLPRHLGARTLMPDIGAVSPDGRHVAVLRAGKVVAYAVDDPSRPVAECEAAGAVEIAVSNGALFLAAERDSRTVQVCDVARGARSEFQLQKGSGEVIRLALSPKGRHVGVVYRDRGRRDPAESDGILARLLDARDGRLVLALSRDAGVRANDIAFGPNGNLAIAGRSRNIFKRAGAVAMWYLAEGRGADWEDFAVHEPGLKSAQHELEGEVLRVAPGLDLGAFVTSTAEQTVLWRRGTDGRYTPGLHLPHQEMLGQETVLLDALNFGADGRTLQTLRRASAGPSGAGHVLESWEASGHAESASVGLPSEVRRVGFRPNGAVVAVAAWPHALEGAAYDPVGGREDVAARIPPGPDASGRFLVHAVSADAQVALAQSDTARSAWEVQDFIGGRTWPIGLDGSPERIVAVAATAGRDHVAVAWRSQGRHLLVVHALHRGGYRAAGRMPLPRAPSEIAVAPGGGLVVIRYPDRTVQVLRTAGQADLTPAELRTADDVDSAVLSPTGQHLVTIRRDRAGGSPSVVQVWTTRDGQAVERLVHQGWVPVAVFSPSGRHLLVAGEDLHTHLLDLHTRQRVRLRDDARVYSAAFSPDGRYHATGSIDGVLRVMLTASPHTEVTRLPHPAGVSSIAFSPDSRFLASGSGQRLRVFQLRPADLVREAEARLDSLRPRGGGPPPAPPEASSGPPRTARRSPGA